MEKDSRERCKYIKPRFYHAVEDGRITVKEHKIKSPDLKVSVVTLEKKKIPRLLENNMRISSVNWWKRLEAKKMHRYFLKLIVKEEKNQVKKALTFLLLFVC